MIKGGSYNVSSYQDPKFNTNNRPMGYVTYIYLLYSGVLLVLHSASLSLSVMHVLFILMPYPLGYAH